MINKNPLTGEKERCIGEMLEGNNHSMLVSTLNVKHFF